MLTTKILSRISSCFALTLTLAISLQNVGIAQENAPSPPPADIKPALNNQNLDEEELRLIKIIHKRIIDNFQSESKLGDSNSNTKTFLPYKETTNSGAQFEMLPIKAGTFTWKGEQDGDSLEVSLSPFWMGKTEVSWNEFEPFMRPKFTREKNGQVKKFMREHIEDDIDFIARPTPIYHPVNHGMPLDDHPAISMTQHSANKYCQWLSYQTGHFYRLPTEAEWEYACRADSKTKYTWGDTPQDAHKFAWIEGAPGSIYKLPGLKKANAWGLQDMQGNLQEWTLDQYVANRATYFGKTKVHNPWIKATKPYPHVIKGGHWKQQLADITASARTPSVKEWKKGDPQEPRSLWYLTDTPWLGLRIVRPAKIPTVEEMYHYWNSGVAKDDL
ncbi:MAG: formylglycine-generating enzyme family protein [Akkermansiaceae bacterium]